MHWVLIIKNLTMIVFFSISSWVALRGLGTWKNKIKSEFEHKLAKKTLLETYKYRLAFHHLRDPFMYSNEYPETTDEESLKNDKKERCKAIRYAYKKRWSGVDQVKITLRECIWECQIQFGNRIKEEYDRILKLEHKVLIEIELYLDSLEPKNKLEKIKFDLMVIYHTGSKEDKINQELESLIKALEKFFEPKIKLRNHFWPFSFLNKK